MRLRVFILFLAMSCCLAHKGKYQRRKRPIFPPRPFPPFPFPTTTPRTTTTRAPPASRPIDPEDDRLAALIGLRLPPKECVIDYDDFVHYVVEMDYITPYGIDNDNFEEMSLKWQPKWRLVNDTHVQRLGSFWNDVEGSCGFLDAVFVRVDERKAITGATGGGTGAFITNQRRDFFVSFDPRRYVIQFICYDTVFRGRCSNSETLLLVKEQRTNGPDGNDLVTGDIVLDDVPWGLIAKTFENCFGQAFVDDTEPQLAWYWTDDQDCPKPDTGAFLRGLGQ